MNPYHCHAYFRKRDNLEEQIDDLNTILDSLYPKKELDPSDYPGLPDIQKIVTSFDGYDFILVPHGGQSHSAFNESIAEGEKCDTAVLRSIYYNQFEGFSSRSNKGTEKTIEYFKKLGINSFVNLVTGSDNYSPNNYPKPRSGGDEDNFVPTWMLAEPTFDGLRLALSESSRLYYGERSPQEYPCSIDSAFLENEQVSIDITLTDGLNVIIGGSSCGKSLLVDAIARKLGYDDDESNYKQFKTDEMEISTSSRRKPHYILQNYILKVIDSKLDSYTLDSLDIVNSVFPNNLDFSAETLHDSEKLKRTINEFVDAIEEVEKAESELLRRDDLINLVTTESSFGNPFDNLLPSTPERNKLRISKAKADEYLEQLDAIQKASSESVLCASIEEHVKEIQEAINNWLYKSNIEDKVYQAFDAAKTEINSVRVERLGDPEIKTKELNELIEKVTKYSSAVRKFENTLETISNWSYSGTSEEDTCGGHKLSIRNNFDIDSEVFFEELSSCYSSSRSIPELNRKNIPSLYSKNTRQRNPKIGTYESLKVVLTDKFEKRRNKEYFITTADGRDWSTLSAGWKTATLLDLIFAYEKDRALLIVDQPEDNLAADYINGKLIDLIKSAKKNRQILIVTHNASIPMLADAQNVILCRENDGKIIIRSARLEGEIEGRKTLDWVAEITDGGKKAIRKRVKKYAMKDYVSKDGDDEIEA